jgi:hypothetical protein
MRIASIKATAPSALSVAPLGRVPRVEVRAHRVRPRHAARGRDRDVGDHVVAVAILRVSGAQIDAERERLPASGESRETLYLFAGDDNHRHGVSRWCRCRRTAVPSR